MAATRAGGNRRPPVDRQQILTLLAERETAQSLDDMVGAFKLLRLNEQEALIHELVAMGRAGLVKLDRRGRYLPAELAVTSPPETPTAPPRPKPPAAKPVEPPAAPAKAEARREPKPAAKSVPAPAQTVKTATASSAAPPRPVRVGDEFSGPVTAHRDGYGFLIPDGGGRGSGDVFLPPREMKTLMHGDRARVRVTGIDERGRREGELLEVLERAHATLVGRIHIDGSAAMLLPSNPRAQDVRIPRKDLGGARQGQMAVVELVTPPSEDAQAVGRVIEVLGEHLEAGMEIETAIRAFHIPHVWPDGVEAEAEAYGDHVTAAQMKDREDLRELPLVTIDGADARDFDDALYAKATRGGWRLWVAIADVSAYVTPGSALDAEAQNRGTSVYFPERVVPMLPEALSNGLCSLNPNVDRLCMVCEMRVSKDGEVSRARFYPAVMRSHARLLYEQVAEALERPDHSGIAQRHPELMTPLQALDGVFAALLAARTARGAIDFESTETKIVFGEGRKIESIVPVTRTRAHRLVEECMIAANVESARLVEKHKIPALYRVHAAPDGDKVAQLREFLAGRGVTLGGGVMPTAPDYAKALASLGDRPDAGLIQTMMLRSLMQARYSPQNDGHFGLSLSHYAHFTSPIRRYPDLLLHRAIRLIVAHRKPRDFAYSMEQMEQLGQLCSAAERRADEATRDVQTWLKCEYMSHRVGDSFDGVITGVAAFGLFVELVGLYVDGMVHISKLGGDYFEYDGPHQRLVGSRSGRVFGLGERLRVQVVRVGLDERKIDLEPEGAGDNAEAGGKRGGRGADKPAGARRGPGKKSRRAKR